MSAFDWIVQLVYVAAASCFVLGLHLMNTPATARRGNQLSTGGMVAAIVATLAIIIHAGTISVTGWIIMLAGALLGGGAGLYAARTVQMTAMPQLVSVFNAVGGGAAALVAIHDYINLAAAAGGVPETTTVPTLLDVIIGAVTFSGSIIAAAFAAMNVVGGYVVTGRMLKMFRRRPVPAADGQNVITHRNGSGS